MADKGKRIPDWSQLSRLSFSAPRSRSRPAEAARTARADNSRSGPLPAPLQDPLPASPETEDEALLRQEMAGVRPLKRGPERQSRRRATPRGKPSDSGDAFVSGKWDLVHTLQGDYIEAAHPSVSQLTMRKLRRGDFSVQARCDLHGLTQEEAKAEILRFVHASSLQQLGCIRIIHGRGNNSAGQEPILKRRVQEWLSSRRLSRYVLAYCSALPRDGGAGAVYVLLRKA